MIKIAICDDEPIICDMLKAAVSGYLEQKNEPCEITCFTCGEGLLHTAINYQILLLDIQMPGISGTQLAKALREKEFEGAIIFVTALKEYVFEAFEYEATDYICKPIDKERLKKALGRAINRIRENNGKCIWIQTMNWCKSVKLDTIYYCEVINRKVYLHTQRDIIEYYCKIEELERQLDSRFVKCHRSYLINLEFVREYADGQVTLENSEVIPVSRLRHQEFLKAMLQYMKKREE